MENFDLKEFAKMFDAALASDNPSVQKALRNFMIVSALVHAQEDGDERVMGPFETLLKEVDDLKRMVYELQNNRTTTYPTKSDYWKDYYGTSPTWLYSPNTSTTSAADHTIWSYKIDSKLDDTLIQQLVKDLKFDDTN